MTGTVLVTDYAWPDLDIERALLGEIGYEIVVAEAGDEADLVARAACVDAILTCWQPVTAAVLDAATRCTTVGRYGVGLDNIDVEHATELGIVVTNVPAYCVDEVAEHTMTLLLGSLRHLVPFAGQVRAGGWDNRAFGPMHRLSALTLGLIGYGRIGHAVAVRARAFGMNVLVHSPRLTPGALGPGITAVASLDALLAESDVVSLHVPLTDRTRHLIDARALALMKPGAHLINTARGPIIDSRALAAAVRSGHLGGAALDVLDSEPPDADDELRRTDGIIVTPHAGFDSVEAIADLQRLAAQNVAAVLTGWRPRDIVNPSVLAGPSRSGQLRPMDSAPAPGVPS
jgi:D-3-phosphoglycerate dehydrogenase